MMGSAYARSLGDASVIVEDTRVAGHMQLSSMHVVLPDRLCLFIVPVTDAHEPLEGAKSIPSTIAWYVIAGQQYVIHTEIFSHENKILITENDDLKWEYNMSKYWDAFLVSSDIAARHGWQRSIFLKPVSPGHGNLTATLTYPNGNQQRDILKVVQDIVICSQVKFSIEETNEHSRIIRLPWAPGVHQEVELMAAGGCARTSKDYNWFSSDIAIVSVSTMGLIRAKRLGQARIKVSSVFDILNYDEVVIEVSVPSSMIMMPNFPVEAAVGAHLQAAVTMKTLHGNYFYRCDAFSPSIHWKVFSGSESFEIAERTEDTWYIPMPDERSTSLPYLPCAWTYLYASGVGRATIQATLVNEVQLSDLKIDGTINLKVSFVIAAYTPLVLLQVGNGNQFGGYSNDFSGTQALSQDINVAKLDELYLVPGTRMDVLLFGGPERWDQEVQYVENVEIFGEENQPLTAGVFVKQASSGWRTYIIFCQTLGNFKLVFSRGNLVGDDHPVPAIEKVSLPLTCSFPSSITMIVNEHVNTLEVIESAKEADRGPGRVHTSPIVVANGCTIRVAAVAVHISGKAFANSSSLYLRWELKGCEDLAHWNDSDSFGRPEASWERFLSLRSSPGSCTIRATVTGFSEVMIGELFEKESLLLENPESILTDAVHLQLVSSLRVLPASVLLFYDPEAKVNLSINGGTCILDAVVNDTHVAEIIQHPASVRCLNLLLGARGLGTALVIVYDIGLSPPVSASSLVKVADIDWVKLILPDELSIMKGTMKAIDILAGTKNGDIFDSSQYVYMNIHVHLEEEILQLVNKDGSARLDDGIHEPNFVISAESLGFTTLYVSAKRKSGLDIVSQLIKVEVYAPLVIHPEYIFLVPGASYMLTIRGGPTLGVVAEFSSMDDMKARIDRASGRVSAISVGNTTIRAVVYGDGGSLISDAFGTVEVGIPSTMILNLQSEQLCVGCEMPIFPSFPEGNLFSFYEVCKDYRWTIEDEKVLNFKMDKSLHSNLHEVPHSSAKGEINSYLSEDKDNAFMMTIRGRSAGRTKVSVTFSCDFFSGTTLPISYNAVESVRVVSDPPLALGIPITWVLPPFYTTSDLLPPSSRSYGTPGKHKQNIVYSLLKSCKKDDVVHASSINGSKIITKESNDIFCIQAEDRTTGRTEIASCVRVAEVAQVRVSVPEFSFHVVFLPLHAKLELTITHCDDLGHPFFEAIAPLDIEINYPDIVSMHTSRGMDSIHGDGRIYLKAKHIGRSLVRVSINKKPEKADYILVTVGVQICPQNPMLHVGHRVNFSLTGDGKTGLMWGQWSSTNKSVISLDKLSGEAHALGEGSTQVHFEGSNLRLQTTVTVHKSAAIIVDSPTETLTNVPLPAKGYNFSIRFSDVPESNVEAVGNNINLLFDCRVDPPFVGYAKAWSDLTTGYSSCLFFPYSPKHLLNLKPDCNKSVITIMGNTDVEIYWNTRDLMSVSLIRKDDHGIGSYAEYEVVKILKYESFTDKITITLPATGQKAEINVNYISDERQESDLKSYFIWGSTVITAVAISIFCMSDLCSRSNRARQRAPTSSAAVEPRTPDHHVSSGTPTRFPRTPQPLVEYVRRTIDETPQYNRMGRRFDLQNTY
ncbi:hypothetical protein QJS10_CPB04g01397 [Acorus calamus]|uniref:BIG2 domain-containing protein n=1 Tax=Acorus calamus TaxID=4465 RepID=A0AAV9EYB6_ACOCL|nr:hypothetical protein QJS10_CPB04g01397 [Acorus calamus]